MTRVVEIVLFKLKASAAEVDFLEAVQPTFDWLVGVDGYISRDLTRGEDGQWADIVHWESMEHALAAQQEMMASSELGAAFAAIDESTLQMLHLRPQIQHKR